MAVKERGILMHARSIRGILEGRKTQTRRIVKPQPEPSAKITSLSDGWLLERWKRQEREFGNFGRAERINCPYGLQGDRLWVRETWAMNDVHYGWGSIPKKQPTKFGGLVYRADGEWKDQFAELDGNIPPWRTSIFMPRWASRLTLEIADMRVERVQDISEEDARAEGVQITDDLTGAAEDLNGSHVAGFRILWDETNGKGAWKRNDWVWVIGFRRMA